MIGVNTFGLAHKMTENLPGTFQAIAEAGFNEVELLMLLMKKQGKIPVALAAKETLPKLIAEANKNGLQVRSVHIFGQNDSKNIPTRRCKYSTFLLSLT